MFILDTFTLDFFQQRRKPGELILRRLKNITEYFRGSNNMKYKIEFGFGAGEDASGRLLLQSEVEIGLQKIRQRAVALYGGYTVTHTTGGWVNPAGRLVEERGFTLSALVEIGFDEQVNFQEMVDVIKSALRQQSVAVTIIKVAWMIV